jgi:hypothetical protein
MRTGLLRGAVTATLVVALGVGGTAVPAQAATYRTTADARAQLVGFDWVGTAITVVALALSGGGGSTDLDAAVQQINAAIQASKTEIIDHIDAVAAAEVQACARSATIEFADINTLSTSVLQLWAQSATSCATKAKAYLEALQSPRAADNIGWVIGPLFAIVVAARTKARLTNGIKLVLQDQISSYELVVAKDKAACSDAWQTWQDNEWGFYTEHRYTCTAFNGEQASWMEYWYGSNVENPIDHTYVEEYPMRDTARPVAQNALPRLRAAM